jgi:hypothetical protein
MRWVIDQIGWGYGWTKVHGPGEWWHVEYIGGCQTLRRRALRVAPTNDDEPSHASEERPLPDPVDLSDAVQAESSGVARCRSRRMTAPDAGRASAPVGLRREDQEVGRPYASAAVRYEVAHE